MKDTHVARLLEDRRMDLADVRVRVKRIDERSKDTDVQRPGPTHSAGSTDVASPPGSWRRSSRT